MIGLVRDCTLNNNQCTIERWQHNLMTQYFKGTNMMIMGSVYFIDTFSIDGRLLCCGVNHGGRYLFVFNYRYIK